LSNSKAIRVQISLGDIPLNVYQMPDGSYRLAGRNVTDAISEPKNSLSQKMGVKSLKALPHAGLSLSPIKSESGESFIPVAIEDAANYWGIMANLGNQKASAILVACTIESIERRADHALGIQVTEELRNARLKARIDGILQRHFWTDCIKWYLDNHSVTSDYRKFIYSRVSDYLNQQFFGMSAKEIREMYSISSSDLLRDHLEPEYLPDITFVEKYAGTLVKKGLEPLTAIMDAVEFSGIQPRQFKVTVNA